MLVRIALFFAASVMLLCGSVIASDVLPSQDTVPYCMIFVDPVVQIDWECIDRQAQAGDTSATILKAVHEGRAVDLRAPAPTIASPGGPTYQCGSDASCRYGMSKRYGVSK